jgi:tetratricopeptide (TPR) repeat protein
LAGEGDATWASRVHLAKQALSAGAGGAAAVRLAELFFENSELDLLAEYSQKALEIGVTGDATVRAYEMAGLAHWYYGRWREAASYFERVLRIDPARKGIADKLEFARVAMNHPGDPVLQLEERWRVLGSLRIAGSDLGQIAVRAGGGNPAYLLLAHTSFERRRFADALAYYEKVIVSDPTNAAAKEGRHRALQALTAPP